MIKQKLIQILSIIESEKKGKPFIEISNQNIVNQIDQVLGINKFLYYSKPCDINICLIHKKKNIYFVKLYWINEALKNNNLK